MGACGARGWLGISSGRRFSSPPPAKKVSSSPMKAVEGTDMMKAGTCPLPREEHSLLVASLLPPRGIFRLTALSAQPVLQPCHQRSPPLHEFPSLGHQISVICHRRVRVQWDPAAGLQFRAPIPSLFHVSAPVSSFASCCLRLLGARESRDAGPGPGPPARGSLQRRGEQAGAAGLQQPAPSRPCWDGAGAPGEVRSGLGTLRPGCGTGKNPEPGSVPTEPSAAGLR